MLNIFTLLFHILLSRIKKWHKNINHMKIMPKPAKQEAIIWTRPEAENCQNILYLYIKRFNRIFLDLWMEYSVYVTNFVCAVHLCYFMARSVLVKASSKVSVKVRKGIQ